MNIIEYIKSDLYRYYGKINLKIFLIAFIKNKGFIFTFWFRLSKSQYKLVSIPSRLILKSKSTKFGIDIPRQTSVGYGLYIGHGGPLVISSSAIIGNNCNLSQFTTIGSNLGNAATIGDNVYIGPNVCIIENILIGNNCTIGAGSIVTKSIPDNATAAGNYAKILNYNNNGKFVINRWIPK